MKRKFRVVDGNTAAVYAAYAFSEVAMIYPITPASPMGEMADFWAVKGRKNIFGDRLKIVEMQSEAGAAGALHGSLCGGALSSTFTASQGLLLMLPNMFKIAGELLPAVFHVSARSLACQSLSIFGDHSDVMAVRGSGFAIVCGCSVQEVADLAVVSHLAAIESRVPFLNFFDGFRTSHELSKVELLDYEIMKSMVDFKSVENFKSGAFNPDKPYAKVGAQNPDVYFQGRESVNKFYDKVGEIVKGSMKKLHEKTGRRYGLFDYVGAKDAKSVIVSMGSSCETIEEVVRYLNRKGGKFGLVKVRLYRPFLSDEFLKVVPKSVRRVAVLDRTKEPGSLGEPLYLDVVSAMRDRKDVRIIGGRYGLGSKEFTPSMVKAVFDHLDDKCFHDFTVGIEDDVTHRSISVRDEIDSELKGVFRCKFWGLGSDGSVGACKNSVKIVGENTDLFGQGYFSYDSKKSGGITISYLRFGKNEIHSPYVPTKYDFVSLHNLSFVDKYDILEGIEDGGIFLLNSSFGCSEVFGCLTKRMQEIIVRKKLKFYVIDAGKIAKEVGLRNRIGTIMQAAFFKLAGVLDVKRAIGLIKDYVKKCFEKKGMDVVRMNWRGIDLALKSLSEVKIPSKVSSYVVERSKLSGDSFVEDVIESIVHLKGDLIPVSKIPVDGKVPSGTMRLEKRGIANEVPHWISEKCIQCGLCSFVCPHAAIRIKQIEKKDLVKVPDSFNVIKSNCKNSRGLMFKVQVYPEDCTGCGNCVGACPVKDKALVMSPIALEREKGESLNAEFFDSLPDGVLDGAIENSVKWTQLKQPLFEFSGACSGCGETPYIKLGTQLFGDRMIIANATGCSSIYGGTFPTIPYSKTKDGKGPVWANSLFEDNAEFGYGIRTGVDCMREQLLKRVEELLKSKVGVKLGRVLRKGVEFWNDTGDEVKRNLNKIRDELILERKKVSSLGKKNLIGEVLKLSDYFVDRSVWAIGGDGWAYDIDFGGLDHVVSLGKNVNLLVLDTEVYSNTGGQASKATPMGAVAKFASAGKDRAKKNLGEMFMSYGNVYVASVCMGANRQQVIQALTEAESYDGPSIVIAYSPCIAHGIDMSKTQEIEKMAVDCGYWPLYRFNPSLKKNKFIWDSPEVSLKFEKYIEKEKRYMILKNEFPDRAKFLFKMAKRVSDGRFDRMKGIGRRD